MRDVSIRADHAERFAGGCVADDHASVENPLLDAIAALDAVFVGIRVRLAIEVGLQVAHHARQIVRVNVTFPFVNCVRAGVLGKSHDFDEPLREHDLTSLNVPIADSVASSLQRELPTFFTRPQSIFHSLTFDGDPGQLGGRFNQPDLRFRRCASLRGVNGKRPQHFARLTTNWLGPTSDQPGASGQFFVRDPIRMRLNVLDNHPFSREGRRAARADSQPDFDAIDRLTIKVRQLGRGSGE